MATDPVWMKDYPTPPCVHCGMPTHMYVRRDGRGFTATVMCDGCDSHGPIPWDEDRETAMKRATERYERSTAVRDRLLKACKRFLDADCADDDDLNYVILAEAMELAREAVRTFTLAGERRPTR